MSKALAEGGVTAAEITFAVPDAVEVIRQVRRVVGDAIVLGAGTVLDPETARTAMLAGAEYIVSPIVNLEVIRLCRRYDTIVMPDAFTPTEVLTAWETGVDVVKVFPADVGGPAFLRALRGPLPQVRLMPTGGVDLTTAEGLPQGGRLLPGDRRGARGTQGDRHRRLHPHSRACLPVCGDRRPSSRDPVISCLS